MLSIKKIAVVLGLLTVAGVAVQANAAESQNVNTHGAACNPYNASEAADIDYLTTGVRTIATSPRRVVCPVPRHPVTGPDQTFWVDGSNSPGKSTICVAYSTTYDGKFNSSYSFTANTPTYDRAVNLSSVGYYDYVSVLCELPAQGGGVLFGVIAGDS
jgi:hypothetical protein